MSKRKHHTRRGAKKNRGGGETNRRSQQVLESRVQEVRRVPDLDHIYRDACALAEAGEYGPARLAYLKLAAGKLPQRFVALVENDLGTLDFLSQDATRARNHFERAIAVDPGLAVPRQNLAVIDAATRTSPTSTPLPPNGSRTQAPLSRIAIVSLLFNWPSTGGGTVHTAELGKFLRRAGYEVRHFYAQYAGWGVGNVTAETGVPSTPLPFDDASWNIDEIQRRFRRAVDEFAPDFVIITDSWNSKPLLAEAMKGYQYFLRLAALECLCPLNNVRLLIDAQGGGVACPRHQLASPHICNDCVLRRQHSSGSLHQAERALSGYGTPEYDQKLRTAFAEAAGVLVVNPLIAAIVGPFASKVHVVPSGFDCDRFPWPWREQPRIGPKTKATIFFAGLVDEYMKGFHILREACERLWRKRQDFELVVTANSPCGVGFQPATAQPEHPFARYVGWLSQDELPSHLRQADFLVFPTIAEEALGRSAVEAMGVGRPVIASRIGGLPFTVADGATGLLFEPGNIDDLAEKIETLLDDPAFRARMGSAARKRFEEHFTWNVIIDRHYRKLFAPIHNFSHGLNPARPAAAAQQKVEQE